MKPPKCKVCGKEEWKHLCTGVPENEMPVVDLTNAKPKAANYKRLNKRELMRMYPDPGFDRNGYQRRYMADKRAAKKLGLTTAEYRAKKASEAVN